MYSTVTNTHTYRERERGGVLMMIMRQNDETQILFSGFDDTPPIIYHGLELTNIDLLSTLPWLNINNLKYKQAYQ